MTCPDPRFEFGLNVSGDSGTYFDFKFVLLNDTFFVSLSAFSASLLIRNHSKAVAQVRNEAGDLVYQPIIDPLTGEAERVSVDFAGVEFSLDSFGAFNFRFRQ